ncbi:hypothetical protein PspLS_03564 [Pyricularia sp. CBS 133598]|nr:hypothetical protein PspLS_03564 [Pyricularia sp. CBS 133598]
MVDKGCEDIKVKADMADARDKALTIHVAALPPTWTPFLVTSTYQKSINVAPGLYVMYVVRRWNMRLKRGR